MFASNPPQVFQVNNENPVLPSKNNSAAHATVSKTPAASSKQRRALGDISNRKQGGGGGAAVPKKTSGIRLQPLQQQRNPLSTKTPKLSKKKDVSFLPRPTQVKQAPSVMILPDFGTSKSTTQQPAQKSVLKNSAKVIVNPSVDDIERSAGRLWVDQLDDDSCTSISLPESNWHTSFNKRRELRLKLSKEQEERDDASYNRYIEKELAKDEISAMIGADVWIERTLSFDIELEDELSFDAPSFCGDISF